MKFFGKAIFSLFLLLSSFALLGTQVVYAQAQPETEVVIAELVQEIEQLQVIIDQRTRIGTVEPFEVEEDVSQYFFLRESTNSETEVYGSELSTIILETDAGVTQILIEQNCLNTSFVTYQSQTSGACISELWMIASEDDGGVLTFEIPVHYARSPEKETVLTISVCRFNGCEKTEEVTIFYKKEREFLDSVNISERYGYEYEYDGDLFFVQELMIDFGGQRVKSLRAGIDCEGRGIRTRAPEKQRLGCRERKKITLTLVDYGQIDDQGNTYDLILEFIARVNNKQVEDSVIVELKITDMSNKVHVLEHQLQINT